VIEFDDSEIEGKEESDGKGHKATDFWSKAFGVARKLMASYQRQSLQKNDTSLIPVEASKLPISSKEIESLPSKDFAVDKGNKNSDLHGKPKGNVEKVNSWKSPTFSSVLEFDDNEHNDEKESDWWTKAFHNEK
jgi:hypothetical protein